MNLIEKLGGYEKAKKELQLKIDGSVFQCCMSVTEDMIKEALLEYRRANNIFQEGDKVVFKKKKSCDMDIYNIVSILDDGLFFGISEYRQAFPSKSFRHATDFEIKAGHRL